MAVVAHRVRPHLPFFWLSHPCDHPGCDREGCYGFGVKLLAKCGGKWFCYAHRDDGMALPQKEPDDDGRSASSRSDAAPGLNPTLPDPQAALFA